MQTEIIVRAYELARSGNYANSTGVKKRLKAEHYMGVDQYFDSVTLKKSLTAVCKAARDAGSDAAAGRDVGHTAAG